LRRDDLTVGLVALYLAAAVAFVVLANDNTQNLGIGGAILLGASVTVGLGTGWWPACLLALALLPLSLPFGGADEWTGNEQPSLVLLAEIWTPLSVLFIVVSTGARKAWERRRKEQAKTEHS
jgi:hypothetical protein